MAKVQPLLTGHTKFNWENRLIALVKAVGLHVLELGDDRTNGVHLTLRRLGMRMSITTRYWGRDKKHDTRITLYGRNSGDLFSVRDTKLLSLVSFIDQEPLTDYRKSYKLLERRVYAMFSGEPASEIMSRGDAIYDSLESKNVTV